LAGLRGWRREGEPIRREFELDDFDKVTVTLSTHSEGGLTENDLELARRMEAVGGWPGG
jgi:hypothetical protein